MCLYPTIARNPKYLPNKKNGGIIPPVFDERVLHVAIGCGRCMECMKQRANSWRVRIYEDLKTNRNAVMVTLTFSNEAYTELAMDAPGDRESYELDNWIATRAMRLFNERWRKAYKKAIRHWMVTELGHRGTENIHMHGILWTDKRDEIETKWSYGWVHVGRWCDEQTVDYIVKYVQKIDVDHKMYKPAILCSPGIGSNYTNSHNAKLNKYVPRETEEAYTNRKGRKQNMPIYWRNKIYSDEEREKLWIEKLDKQIRYVDGIEIKIDKGETEYYKALETARKKNDTLGYGNNKKNWEREEYERIRRIMKQQERIKNSKIIIKRHAAKAARK